MPKKVDSFTRLINSLKFLPSVGPKTAQRMAYQLLNNDRTGAEELSKALLAALKEVRHCKMCNTFCEGELCNICADSSRDNSVLMIVQMPVDIHSIEITNSHQGYYFVLMGQVNPLKNNDLTSIALEKLLSRLTNSNIKEIIIATNFTQDGDATAFVLSELFKESLYKVSRLARGIPLGGELEYIDAGTLAQSVYERKLIE